jgi:hypothetical protein
VSAAPAPAAKPAADEPTTLRELYERARGDVGKPSPEVALRWVFLHARIAGRLEVARGALKRIEQRDWDVCMRASAHYPETSVYSHIMATRPEADIKRAEALVTEMAAMEHAARDVVAMLGPRR